MEALHNVFTWAFFFNWTFGQFKDKAIPILEFISHLKFRTSGIEYLFHFKVFLRHIPLITQRNASMSFALSRLSHSYFEASIAHLHGNKRHECKQKQQQFMDHEIIASGILPTYIESAD